jgi:lysophospholipase L1-like esterase
MCFLKNFQANIKGVKMKTILCYGDSNTHGTLPIDFDMTETPFTPSDYRLPWDKRWTGILQRELGAGYYVIEEGLNGRTTVWDDPIEGVHKNGLKYLVPCLESHAPVDLVLLMLGTNDLKTRFSVSAFDIALSIGVLVNTIQQSGFGPAGKNPGILLMCPPPLGKMSYLAELFTDGVKNSLELAKYYRKIAKLYGCDFLDVSEVIRPSDIDGIHYEEKEVEKLGLELVKKVKQILK